MRSKRRLITIAAVIIVMIILAIAPIHIYHSRYIADDWYQPLTSWSCDDPEISIEIYEDWGQNNSIVLDGRKNEIEIGTLYDAVYFDRIGQDGIYEPLFAGEVIPHLLSDDVTIEVFESNIEQVKPGDSFILHKFDD